MPEMTPAPAPGGGAQAQTPPFGASPATGPTPNKGFEAAAMQRLGIIVKQLTELLSLAGATSDVGKDVLKALNTLTKHVPAGSVTPASERNNIDRMSMQNTQNNQQMQAMKQMQAGGGQQQPPAAQKAA